jgi:antitoxin component of RelBE/YafQ-DinJ toxin-antitoxin module
MPNQPKTPVKCFRIPQDLYERAQQVAAEKGITLTEVVRVALENLVKQ